MADEVGGQLEAKPRPQSLFGPDYLRLAILAAVAVAVHVWLVAHTAVPARDSLGYARLALNLTDPEAGAEPEKPKVSGAVWGAEGRPVLTGAMRSDQPRQRIDVIRDAEQPPGYPLAVAIAEHALRYCVDMPLAERALLATQVANAFAAVLLVVPMYLIGRILFSRNVGFAAALLFQVLPVPARVTSDGLSEGVYLCAIAVAIMFGVRAVRRSTVGGFLLCGLASGASYLVRPEGLMVVMSVGTVVIAAGLSRRWPRDVAMGRLAALGVGAALIAVPYMVLIGKVTNKPTGGMILNPGEAPLIWRGQPGARIGANAPLFAAWWDPDKDTGRNRVAWSIEAVGGEIIKSQHYVVGVLAVFALLAHRRQLFVPDPGMWVLIILGTLNLLLLSYLAVRIGYVSERHTVLFTMLCCVFAGAALEPLAHAVENLPKLGRLVIWPQAAPATILVGLVLAALPYTIKPMHPQREGHKHAGQWLAGQIKDTDWLRDPLSWGEWYAGRTLYRPPVCHGTPTSVWVIVEKRGDKESPHSRLPLWDEAVRVTAGRTPKYQWPEDPKAPFAVQVFQVSKDEYDRAMSAKP